MDRSEAARHDSAARRDSARRPAALWRLGERGEAERGREATVMSAARCSSTGRFETERRPLSQGDMTRGRSGFPHDWSQ